MRIIGVSGVWCYWKGLNPIWQNLVPAFLEAFPDSVMVVEEEPRCQPWQVGALCALRDRILEKYDDGEDVLLVGHSMGGVVACAAAKRFRKSKVIGVVTIYSPHRMHGSGFTRVLGAEGEIPAPVVSFGATRDILVWDVFVWWDAARHPHARLHTTLVSDHQDDLVRDRSLCAHIADVSRRQLQRET